MKKLPLILVLLIVLLTLSFSKSFSQINTELIRKISPDKGWYNSLALSISSVSGNSEYMDYALGFRSDMFFDKVYTFLAGQLRYNEGTGKINLSRGFIHYRFVYDAIDLASPEGYVQKNYDRSIFLDDRWIVGGGLRFKFLNIDPKNDSSVKVTFTLGEGGFFEYEKIGPAAGDYTTRLARQSTYLNVNLQFNKIFSFNATGYFQNSFESFSDHRILANMTALVKPMNHLSFGLNLNYRYDNEPTGDLKKYFLEINNTIAFEF